MKHKKLLRIEEIAKVMKSYGYYASEELQYNAFIGLLNFGKNELNCGQDIFATCLEGPPGAGKTEYAKIYTKLVAEFCNGEVELVDYQCDATTGKTELFEDINISAAIRGDADNVNIPGKLIEAINKVNAGKKAVLFIDEYDKAREETDAFLLQFLQSGRINSTQHGDLGIKEEYKNNLQVIICKNDTRESLSGPLSRRIRIIRLDYMAPETFYMVAKRKLIDDKASNKVDEGLLNLVSLIYNNAYNNRELFCRLPSCSEMLIAIQDADNLIKYVNAPKYIVYKTVIENMFKELDDIKTFESKLDSGDNSELKALISEMRLEGPEGSKNESLTDLIAKTVFKNETSKLEAKIAEATAFINEYEKRFDELESQRKHAIEEEIKQISLANDEFVFEKDTPQVLGNFQDETAYIKRGKSVFGNNSENWTEIASASCPEIFSLKFIPHLIKNAKELNLIVYEDGFQINKQSDFRLVMIRDHSDMDNKKIKFYSNHIIVPATALEDVFVMLDTIIDSSNARTVKDVIPEYDVTGQNKRSKVKFNLDCLIYNEHKIPGFSSLNGYENIYNVHFEDEGDPYHCVFIFNNHIKQYIKVYNIEKVISLSNDMLKGNDNMKTLCRR
jgi:hypothetical protein